jgi:adenylosuccinate lyase
MTDDRWRSPLGSRYASPAMQTLWGERHRIGLWRRLWLALAETERELGLDIPERPSLRCELIWMIQIWTPLRDTSGDFATT